MNGSLQEAKKKVQARYLGKHGIHGVGVSESENAICVYLHEPNGPDQEVTLKQIENEIAPVKVIKIVEGPPRITSARSPC